MTEYIKLIEERERHFIKKISYELMALDGSIPRDLFHELDMDQNKVVDNQDAVKSKTTIGHITHTEKRMVDMCDGN